MLLNEDRRAGCFQISVAILLHGRISLADADVRGEVAGHSGNGDLLLLGSNHAVALLLDDALDGGDGGRLGVDRRRRRRLVLLLGARNHEAAREGSVAGQAVDVRQRHHFGHGGEARALHGRLLRRPLPDAASRAPLRREVDADVDEHHDAARDVERAQRRVQHVADVLAQLKHATSILLAKNKFILSKNQ